MVVLGGAGLMAGWALLPVVLFGIDPTLDPVRFATYRRARAHAGRRAAR